MKKFVPEILAYIFIVILMAGYSVGMYSFQGFSWWILIPVIFLLGVYKLIKFLNTYPEFKLKQEYAKEKRLKRLTKVDLMKYSDQHWNQMARTGQLSSPAFWHQIAIEYKKRTGKDLPLAPEIQDESFITFLERKLRPSNPETVWDMARMQAIQNCDYEDLDKIVEIFKKAKGDWNK